MNRVRKDILNGWKEIGGYVCRDIRTVERWEKHRGLPVRRVPGAGRATVYALISEVDEWLASAKDDDTDDSPDIAIHVTTHIASEPLHMSAYEAAAEEEVRQASIPLVAPLNEPISIATGYESQAEAAHLSQPRVPRGRSWIAAIGVAAAIVLMTAIVWPLMVQARRGTSADNIAPSDAATARVAPSVPYRSDVPGVDDLYLSGIYFCEQRTPDSLEHALDNFTQAVARDPNYAPAYAGLAITYNLLREYSTMPDAEAYAKARTAAERAIALDPKLPQAHASLGFIDFFSAWNSTAAEKEFQTALALDPSSVLAHHWYGSMLIHQGRYAEAIAQLDMAQRLEPTSAAILSLRALALGLSGHRDEAMARLEDIQKEAPSASSPHNVLGMLSLMEPRDIPRYLAETRRVAELRHDQDWLQITAVGERSYHSSGETAMWESMLESQKRLHPTLASTTYPMAQEEAVLGHTDEAFAIMSKLVDEHNPTAIGILNDPILRRLHHDPRFEQIMAKIGLPALPAVTPDAQK